MNITKSYDIANNHFILAFCPGCKGIKRDYLHLYTI